VSAGVESFLDRLHEAYGMVGAHDADIVYIYSDFRTFGRYAAEFPDRNAFCQAVVGPFLERERTVVVSTFTYTSEGRFDVCSTPTRLGVLNKWILGAAGARRSEHPLFSYGAIGPRAGLVEGIGKSAFGAGSVFERLLGQNAVFLYVGRPLWMGNTMLHYIEQCCGATYRFHKAFRTEVYRGEQYVGTDYTAFVRRLDVPGHIFNFAFREAAERLAAAGLVRHVGSDDEFTNVSCLRYDETADALTDMFYRDPMIFIGDPFIQY
jgi:aminoglycoside N3'-acetyltransferase